MAISTNTIQDTINWAKRLSFNRNPVIGNSLEPALSSANMVMQTILGPPFTWWWNSKELVFTCDPTFQTATISSIQITADVATVTAANDFSVGELVTLHDISAATFLEDQIVRIDTVSLTQFTFEYIHANYGPTANTGTAKAVTTQDYTVPSPEFSHIEHASILDVDASGNPVKWFELTVKNDLSLDSTLARPQFIGPHDEDSEGNITFRVMSSPNKKYPVAVHAQLAAPKVVSINQTWAPIPDFMSNIYNWGFMALMWQFADDNRWAYASDKFVSGILARAEGLDEQQRNIFLANWNNLITNGGMMNQMGQAARGK